MKSKKLKIVVALAALGFLGLLICKKKKNAITISEQPSSKTKTVNTAFRNEPQTSEMSSGNFTTPEDWIEYILRETVEEETFGLLDQLLEMVVLRCNIYCEVDAWMEKVPAGVEDLEELLLKYDLYGKAVAKIYNGYIGKN